MSNVPRPQEVSELRQWYAVLSSQVSHYFRTYRFLGLLGFVVFISCLSLVFQFQAGAALVRQEQLQRSTEYLAHFALVLTALWVIIAAAFFGGDALSVDFSSGTGYYMLVLPIHRRTLLAGRYASATIATLAIVFVYYGLGILGDAYFFGPAAVPLGPLAVSLALAVVFTLAAVSVAFCISAFVRSPSTGVLVTILALYVGSMTLETTVELAGYEPWWSLTYAGDAMSAAIDLDYTHLQKVPVGQGQFISNWSASTTEGAVIMTAYLAFFFVLSLYLYRRKESTN
jgi:ABC-type transport system involved in multi-copper enzyme maturation permease subunit